jgi:precorrin-8X/cobalt-precorrin-8 methylmutase
MLPHEIESESFRIIRSEMGPHHFDEQQLAIVVRVIHATGDFDYSNNLRFHPEAIPSGLAALQRGCTIVADVRMVEAGIASRILARFGGRVMCDIDGSDVSEAAGTQGLTRATVAMRRNAAQLDGTIVAIGNAPTALMEVLRLVREDGIRPALIVGVPVGFVNAAESKADLCAQEVPYVTSLGRKGGSSVAVATVNALLRMLPPPCKD